MPTVFLLGCLDRIPFVPFDFRGAMGPSDLPIAWKKLRSEGGCPDGRIWMYLGSHRVRILKTSIVQPILANAVFFACVRLVAALGATLQSTRKNCQFPKNPKRDLTYTHCCAIHF